MRLIAILVAVVAIAALGIGGTLAYFSDVETSGGNSMTAGTLDLQVHDAAPTDWDDGAAATWVSPPNWAPGETVTSTINLRNAGSRGSRHLFAKPTDLAGTTGFGDQILVTSFIVNAGAETGDTGPWEGGNWGGEWVGWMTSVWGDGVAPLTLAEFAGQHGPAWSVWWWEGPGGPGDPRDGTLLPPDGVDPNSVTMTLQFDPASGNAWQNANASFVLRTATFNGAPGEYHSVWEGGSGYGYQGE